MYKLLSNLTGAERELLATLMVDYLEQEFTFGSVQSKVVKEDEEGFQFKVATAKSISDYQQVKTKDGGEKVDYRTFNYLLGASKVNTVIHSKKEVFHPSCGLLSASAPSGDFDLFQVLAAERNAMSLRFSGASSVKGSCEDAVDSKHLSESNRFYQLYLSPDQYIQLLGAQNAEIPCTISMELGENYDAPTKAYDTRLLTVKKLKKELSQVFDRTARLSVEVFDLLESGPVNSKKKVQAIDDAFRKLRAEYESAVDIANEIKKNSVSELTGIYMEDMAKAFSEQLSALPESVRHRVLIPNLIEG